MIFLFDGEHEITMWMKNTYIPLDMVFIGATGHHAYRLMMRSRFRPMSSHLCALSFPGSGDRGRTGQKTRVSVGDIVALQK